MPVKISLEQKNVDRIAALVAGPSEKLFSGNSDLGFLYWGADLHLLEASDPPTEDDLLQNITEGNDLGLDCYYIDSDEQTIWLFQSKFRYKPGNIPHKEVADFLRVPSRLVDPRVLSAITNTKLLDFAPVFKMSLLEGMQLKLVYFTTERTHRIVEAEIQNWVQLPLHLLVGGQELEIKHAAVLSDLTDLLTRSDSLTSAKPVDSDLRLAPTYWHEAAPKSGFKCLMATVELEELAKLFNTYKYSLFRDNPLLLNQSINPI